MGGSRKMKKKIFVMGLVSMFLLTSILTVKSIDVETEKKDGEIINTNHFVDFDYGPQVLEDVCIYDVAVDSNGNVIAVGPQWTVKRNSNDGNIIWLNDEYYTCVAVDSNDNIIGGIFFDELFDFQYKIVKYDKDGNELFTRTYQKYGNSPLQDIAIDLQDNIVLTGYATDGEPGSYPTETWTIKVDGETGDILAENILTSGDHFHALVSVDSEDNIILVGTMWDNKNNLVIRKCNNDDLNEQWSITTDYPDNYALYPSAVTTDSQNNIIISGIRALVGSPEYNFSYFTVKFDKNGVDVWGSPVIYDNFGIDDKATDVAVDSQNNIIVCGNRGDTIKYDKDGNELWQRIINGYCSGIAVDSSNNIIVGGSLYRTVKYDKNGNVLWEKVINRPSDPTIDGPTKYKPGVEYTYLISSTDPDGDQVYYYIDWDDGTNSGWIGPYVSGEEVYVSHTWTKKEIFYVIEVMSKDIYGVFCKINARYGVDLEKNRVINKPFLTFLENYPNLFSILQRLIKF